MTTEQAPALQKAWGEYLRLNVEGNRLTAEGEEMDRQRRPKAEGGKLQLEGLKLFIKAEAYWEKAVEAVYGNMAYKLVWNAQWKCYECLLANGDVYRSPREESV